MSERFDAVIVGAGPGGSAAALAALRDAPGARVLILDRAPIGRDKVCGDGIPEHTIADLEALGVTAAEPQDSVQSVRLSAPGFADGSAATPSPASVVPRTVLDERLLTSAIRAGAVFRQERVTAVSQDANAVTVNGAYTAPVLIGADGSNSVVRRSIGQPSNQGRTLAVAVRGYVPTPAGARNELDIRWDPGRAAPSYAWAFPLAGGRTNVGYGTSTAGLAGGRAELESRLRALLPEYAVGGAVLAGHTLPLSTARVMRANGRVLLVGDAASLINPLSGEGIHTAVFSGALAGSLAVRRPADAARLYLRELRRRLSVQQVQLRFLTPLLESRTALATVLAACQRDPRVYDRLLAVGLGDRSFRLVDAIRVLRHWTRPDGT